MKNKEIIKNKKDMNRVWVIVIFLILANLLKIFIGGGALTIGLYYIVSFIIANLIVNLFMKNKEKKK